MKKDSFGMTGKIGCHAESIFLHKGIKMTVGNYYVYITTNPGKKVLYTGVTNDLTRRLQEHYNNRDKTNSFVGKYYCYKLIFYEYHTDINQAIRREKEIKI
jgi:putative endonuclease